MVRNKASPLFVDTGGCRVYLSVMKITQFFPKNLYQNKTVFVTGGGSGINLGIARHFAALGAHVAICGRTEEKLQNAQKEIAEFGGKVIYVVADVRDYDALETGLMRVKNELGPVDVLVCGAAGNFYCPAEQLSANGFKTVIDIDLLGSFNAARAAFAQLKDTRGSVIFISAGQSFQAYLAQAHVGAAKAGIDNLMKNLALEWGRFGIRSNSIVPGPIEGTEGMNRLGVGGINEKLKKIVPLKRLGTIDDVAETSVFLASPLASYITGTCVVVDGGQNLPGSGQLADCLMEELAVAKKPGSL